LQNIRIRTPFLTYKFYLKGPASAREAVEKIIGIEKEEKVRFSVEAVKAFSSAEADFASVLSNSTISVSKSSSAQNRS